MQNLLQKHFKDIKKFSQDGHYQIFEARDLAENEVFLEFFSAPTQMNEAFFRFKTDIEKLLLPEIPELWASYELIERDKHFVLVKEKLSGRPLSEVSSELSVEEKIEVIFQIGNALSYAYQKGVLHRSLAPKYVYVSRENGIQVKVFGFGFFYISAYLNNEPGLYYKKYLYTAPEQTGILKRDCDQRSDLYSLGALAFELLTGKPPFYEKDEGKLIYAHLAQKPDKSLLQEIELPDEIIAIILKLLEKEPRKRFQNYQDFLNELDLLLTNKQPQIKDFSEKKASQDRTIQTDVFIRKKELEKLYEIYQKVLQRNPEFLVLKGGAGLGKSRLIETLEEKVLTDRPMIFTFKCNSSSQNEPYTPFLSILKNFFNIEYPKLGQDKEKLGFFSPWFELLQDYIEEKTENEIDKDADNHGEKEKLNPEKLFKTIVLFLRVIAGIRKELIIIIENAHWIDHDSLKLLSYIKTNLKNSPSLFLLTLNPEIKQEHKLERYIKSFTFLELFPLNQGESRELVHQLFGGQILNFSEDFYAKIFKWSQGKPLFILELARSLVNQRIVQFQKNGWILSSSRLESLSFGSEFSHIVQEKMKGLNREEQILLSLASVIGREFTVDFLKKLMAHGIEKKLLRISKKEAEASLLKYIVKFIDRAIAMQLMEGDQLRGKTGTYVIPDMANQVLYENLKENQKSAFHELLAEIIELESTESNGDKVFQLAYHYNHSKQYEKAIKYNLLAYKACLSRYALSEAVFYGRKILDSRLTDNNNGLKQEEVSEFVKMIQQMNAVGEISLALNYAKKILAQMEGKEWQQEKLEVLLAIGTCFYLLNNNLKAMEHYQEALNLAKKAGEEIRSPYPYKLMGLSHFLKLELKQAENFFSKAIQYTPDGAIGELLHLYGLRSWVYSTFGEFEAAKDDVEWIEERVHQVQTPLTLSAVYHYISLFYSWSGLNPEKGLNYAMQSYQEAQKANAVVFEYSALYSEMSAYFMLGNFERCEEVFYHAKEISSQKEVYVGIEVFWSLLAETYLFRHEFQKANDIALKFLPQKKRIQRQPSFLTFLLAHAFYLFVQGDVSSCFRILEEGIEIYEETKMEPLGILLYLLKARLMEKMGLMRESRKLQERNQKVLEEKKLLSFLYKKYQRLLLELEPSMNIEFNQKMGDSPGLKEKHQLSNIVQTSQMISSVLDIESLLELVLNKTLELTGASRGALALWNEKSEKFELKMHKNMDSIEEEKKHLLDLLEQVAQSKTGVIKNIHNISLFEELTKQGIESILCTPIVLKGKVIGVLYLDSKYLENLFSGKDLEVLEVFTVQAGIAIENAMLYQNLENQVRERTRELESLNRLSHVVNATFDIKEIIKALFYIFSENFNIEGVGVQSIDDNKQNFQFIEIFAPSLNSDVINDIKKLSVPFSRKGGTCYWVATSRQDFYMPEIREEKNLNYYDKRGLDALKHRSVLIIPLELHQEVIGLLHCFTYTHKMGLSMEEIEKIKQYTAQVVTAIHNSRLYGSLALEKKTLEKLNQELKETQTQLIQTEKMASLGQLTAGIAHEINNPLSFVINNNFVINEIIKDISSDDTSGGEVIQDIGLLNTKSKEGLKRIKTIVENLRTFSRMDQGEKGAVDVNHCILSTLSLLEHFFRDEIELIQDLKPVPPVLGSEGQLNQVFMNIIVNAIDALNGKGEIQITTELKQDRVVIIIRDNGEGIPQEIQNKIFDPFFTSKEVGKGTGLGLSISYGIIQEHDGVIQVSSEPGAGTHFQIELPRGD